jgi:hypothetical protein
LAQNKHVFIGIVLLQVLFQCISDVVIASARDPTTSSDALVAAVPPLLISCHLFFDVYGIVLGVFLGKQVVVLVVYQRARAKKALLKHRRDLQKQQQRSSTAVAFVTGRSANDSHDSQDSQSVSSSATAATRRSSLFFSFSRRSSGLSNRPKTDPLLVFLRPLYVDAVVYSVCGTQHRLLY